MIRLLFAVLFATIMWQEAARADLSSSIEMLTGGHTRLVWCESSGSSANRYCTDPINKLMGIDTDDGRGIVAINATRSYYSKATITPAGDRVVFNNYGTGMVEIINWDGTGQRNLVRGLMADVYLDTETGVEYVIVGSDAPGYIKKYAIDDIGDSAVVWNLTTVGSSSFNSITFQVSGDLKHGFGGFPWPNTGYASLPNTAVDIVDEGCWPAMTPDLNYIGFVFNTDHRTASMYGPGGVFMTEIDLNDAPGIRGWEICHIKWGNMSDFITMTGPYDGGDDGVCVSEDCGNFMGAGGTSMDLYLGRLTADRMEVEQWVQVTDNDQADFFGDVWVDTGTVVRRAPSVIMQPRARTVFENGNVMLEVKAAGYPYPDYQWRKDGVDIDGAVYSVLKLSRVTAADAGTYDVVIANIVDSAVSGGAVLAVEELSGDYLVLHYTFENGMCADAAGSSDGEIYGATASADAAVGNGSFLFDGNDRINAGRGGVLNDLNPCSYSMWIKPAVLGGAVIGKEQNRAFWHGRELAVETDGSVSFQIGRSGDNDYTRTAAGAVAAGAWQHLALTRSAAGTVKVYVNGAEPDYDSVVIGGGRYISDYEGELSVGAYRSYGGRYFSGLIDDVRMYNYPLSRNEIDSLFAMGDTKAPGGDTTVVDTIAEFSEWQTFTYSSAARAVAVDGGVTWIGTTGGLVKKDGSTTMHFNRGNSGLPSNNISALAVSGTGVLWVGTADAGLASFDGSTWRTYTVADGIADDYVTALLVDTSGNVWAGSDGSGVARLSGSTWSIITIADGLPANSVFSLARTADGTVWVGTGFGLAKQNGTGWDTYDSYTSDLPNNWIMSLAADMDGGIWVGTVSKGAAKFNGTDTWTVYNTTNSDLPDKRVTCLTTRTGGGVWMGTPGGAAGFDGVSAWTVATAAGTALPEDNITCIAMGTDGSVYAGTGQGSAKLSGGTWTLLNTTGSGLPGNNIISMDAGSDGGVWVGTKEGAARLASNGIWSVYTAANSALALNTVTAIEVTPDDGVWFGTGNFQAGNLARFKDGSWTAWAPVNSDLPSEHITALHCGSDGRMWVGTQEGLAVLEDSSWTVYDNTNSGMPRNEVTSIAEDTDGTLWMGSAEYYFFMAAGLTSFNGTDWNILDAAGSDLPDDFVTDVAVDASGGIWAATDGGGLAKFDGTSVWQVYTAAGGAFPSDAVYTVEVADDGRIWAGTAAGVAILDGSGWTVLNTANSKIPHNAVTGITFDTEGNTWIACGSGNGPNAGPNVGGLTVCRTCAAGAPVTDIVPAAAAVPAVLDISPSPFTSGTLVSFMIPAAGRTSVCIMDMRGNRVRTLLDRTAEAGTYRAVWDGTDDAGLAAAPGIYVCVLAAADGSRSCAMVIRAE